MIAVPLDRSLGPVGGLMNEAANLWLGRRGERRMDAGKVCNLYIDLPLASGQRIKTRDFQVPKWRASLGAPPNQSMYKLHTRASRSPGIFFQPALLGSQSSMDSLFDATQVRRSSSNKSLTPIQASDHVSLMLPKWMRKPNNSAVDRLGRAKLQW